MTSGRRRCRRGRDLAFGTATEVTLSLRVTHYTVFLFGLSREACEENLARRTWLSSVYISRDWETSPNVPQALCFAVSPPEETFPVPRVRVLLTIWRVFSRPLTLFRILVLFAVLLSRIVFAPHLELFAVVVFLALRCF